MGYRHIGQSTYLTQARRNFDDQQLEREVNMDFDFENSTRSVYVLHAELNF
jgi:hypothetical protein